MSRKLDERIATAFTPDARSEDFASLIADVEKAAKAADTTAAAARERALDPTIAAAEVDHARSEMDNSVFRSDRLNVAVKRLRDRHKQVAAAEENQRRQLEYDRVVLARDELVKELGDVYPQAAAKLADLMSRVAANDREIETTKLPNGAGRILESELVARGLEGFVQDGIEALSLVRELRIPNWEHSVHAPYAYIVSDNFITTAPPNVRIVKV